MQTQLNQNRSKLKVGDYIFILNEYLQGPSNPKYKTTLCKKFLSGEGCPYGDKCQFAHGSQELRLFSGQKINQFSTNMNKQNNKAQSNILNYKIVKCKNWEKDRTCKYGAHCTFAHGDNELRNKSDNLYQMDQAFPLMIPMMMPTQGIDTNQMQQLMMTNQLMMEMGINPYIPIQNNAIPFEKKE